jgi:hypothetical protein
MIEHIGDVATSPFSLAVIAVASVVNLGIGIVGGMFGAQINDGTLVAFGLAVMGIGTGILGWSLVLLIKLSQVVARLETTAEDHDRRLGNLER